jgi:hypothetical protein
MLRLFNVDWVEMGQEEFLADVLGSLDTERARGLAVFQRRGAGRGSHEILPRVADLRTQPASDLREFVMGRDRFGPTSPTRATRSSASLRRISMKPSRRGRLES